MQPTGSGRGKVVVVVIDAIGLNDLDSSELPTLSRLVREGALGLMNTRTAGAGSPAGYLTVGAGERAIAPPHGDGARLSGFAFDAEEPVAGISAGRRFQARTGIRPPADSVVHLFASQLDQANLSHERGAVAGLLGSTLTAAGLKVGVVGNADTAGGIAREIVLIAMDRHGLVGSGEVGRSLVRAAPDSPAMTSTDYTRLSGSAQRILPKVDVLFIETGDTSRINAEAQLMDPSARSESRLEALRSADSYLSGLLSTLSGNRDSVFIITPSPPAEREPWDRLVPFLVWARGIGPGLAVSPSTRRPGMVTNMDVAPSILSAADVETPAGMAGRPAYSTAHPQPMSFLQARERKIVLTESLRRPVITAFVTLAVGVVLASLLVVVTGAEGLLRGAVRFSLLFLLSVPLALLVTAGAGFLSNLAGPEAALAATIGFMVAVALALSLAASALYRFGATVPIFFLGVITSIVVLADIVFGASLMLDAILGYSVIAGSRFYGVGNEYMGIFLGATIVGLGALSESIKGRWRTYLVAVTLFLALALLGMALPFWGANIGGTVAVSAGFSVLLIKLMGRRISWREGAVLLGAILAAVGLVVLVDLLSASKTHAARVFTSLLTSDGSAELVRIVQRKATMNLKLLQYTAWSQILVVCIAAVAVLAVSSRPLLHRLRQRYPRLTASLGALVVGSLFALVFNDSGVIAGAAAVLFGVGAMLYLLLSPLASEEPSA